MIKINDKVFTYDKFPNGEKKITLDFYNCIECKNNIFVEWHYENDGELIDLMFLKKHFDKYNKRNVSIILDIKYMPYSRMDRVKSADEIFTLKYVCEFINDLNFNTVYTNETHSNVTDALLNASKTSTIEEYLGLVLNDLNFNKNIDYVMFPDEGACKRYSDNIKLENTLVGYKQRDWETGNIKSLSLLGKNEYNDQKVKVLIIDDLCSYGGTFKYSAEEIKKIIPNSEIYLFIAHCENSIHQGELLKDNGLIDKIYTTDSLLTNWDNNKLINVENL